MRTKTASVRVTHVYGTGASMYATVHYRGRLVWHKCTCTTPNAAATQAVGVALGLGFTQCKVQYG